MELLWISASKNGKAPFGHENSSLIKVFSEDIEQIEVFHRNFLRRLLRIRKSAPKAMTYEELGQQELKFTKWQRMASFWKKTVVR